MRGCLVMVVVAQWLLLSSCHPEEAMPGAAPAELILAPLAAEFVAHLQGPTRAAGVIPETVDLAHLSQLPPALDQAIDGQEKKYDMRSLGVLTPIKAQNGNQSCWTFPPMAALESNLLPGERWDFAEENLRCTHGFDLAPQDGGNVMMAMAYLARTGGPVAEKDDPYPTLKKAPCASPPGLAHQKVVTEMLIIPDRKSPLDNAGVKAAIKKYGPLMTCMDYDSRHYLPMWKSFRNPNPVTCSHMVNLVGWDDTFDGFGFQVSAPGHGAFIFRNSWGKTWAEGGYGYASYYDPMIGTSNRAFYRATNPPRGGRVYQHDPLGWISSVGYQQPTAWMANIFSAVADEPLHSVSFYAASPNSTYEVRIYGGLSSGPVGKSLLGARSGALDMAGYHTVALDSLKITLEARRAFSVVVQLTTPGFNKPVPVEYPVSGYSSQASASAGQSYVSQDGVTWSDLTGSIANANVCLKAFTGTRDPALGCGNQTFDGSTWSTSPAPATRVCRAVQGPCDLPETCDGLTTRCPADTFRPASHVCRGSIGTCDKAEHCSGSAPTCPAAAFYPRGIFCRPAADECDLTEVCPGDGQHCPADAVKEDGAPCAGGEGICEAGWCEPDSGCSLSGGGADQTGTLFLLLLLLVARPRNRPPISTAPPSRDNSTVDC